MKKYNLYLWLAALVGLFASCSQDETDTLQTNESNRVSLTAELPDDFAQIGTRALPNVPGGHTLRCILEVWTKDQTPVLKHREEQIDLSGSNVEFNFTIDAGTYDCLFWADFIETTPSEDKNAQIGDVKYTHYADKYYKTDDATNGLKAISIIDGVYAAGFNTDVRDAFFGNYKLNKGAEAIENPSIPSLTRPFAKLTIKEKNATNYNDCSGLTAEYEVPKTFNVSTAGVVAGSTVEVTCYSKSSESQVLFSDYIFTDANSNLGEVTLNFTSASDRTFQTVTIPAGIPLKRNFRTNATGNLIMVAPAPTNSVKMTVTMDADWDEADVEGDATQWDGVSFTEPAGYDADEAGTIDITSATELAWLAWQCNIGGNTFQDYTFNLTTDIDLNNHNWTPIGFSTGNNFKGKFNGQGHTVRNMKVDIKRDDVVYAGLFGCVEGAHDNFAEISNLIVEGDVNCVSTTTLGSAGGICGRALYVVLEFCRFNGTVSSTAGSSSYIHSGGIVGSYGGGHQPLTCCISDATVTNGEVEFMSLGGLAGSSEKKNDITYSAWNSSQTTEAVGTGTGGTFDSETSPKPFTTIAELNGLLDDINKSKSGSEYKWQPGNGDDAYPILVKRADDIN